MATVNIGLAIKSSRVRAGMTQRQLADLATVSIRTIRDIESDRTRSPRRDTIRLLSDALRLSDVRRRELEAAARSSAVVTTESELRPPPAAIKPIFGRQREICALVTRLESAAGRLTVVAGLPGVGKSRLMLEAAQVLHASARLRVVWVSLSDIPDDSASLGHAVADFFKSECSLEDVVPMFADRKVLLFLDGYEQKKIGPARVLRLLERCPKLDIVLESNETSLDFGEGIRHTVYPLDTPEPGDVLSPDATKYPAIEFLFRQYSRADLVALKDPGFIAKAVEICWLLDGLPAALEIAASWLTLYKTESLLNFICDSQSSFFEFHFAVGKDLCASIRSSISALSVSELTSLELLAGIEYSWTIEEAALLNRGSLMGFAHQVHTLCTVGMIRPVEQVGSDVPRFTVLHVVRRLLKEPRPTSIATRSRKLDGQGLGFDRPAVVNYGP